ncbi:hypothetical protein ACG02S_07810 [Roseateles sp. DC23W]|uniref:Uncharacterized protein n=1 Tax=Pelomonas dachongensis TaxID=3299029 RepID=A0ABW7EK36_9BURK
MDNSIFFAAFRAAGFLKPAVYKPGQPGEKSFDCQWQSPDMLLLADEAQGAEFLIEFQTADLPPLRIDDRIDVDGVSYAVRTPPMKKGDAFFSTVALKPA